MSTKDKVIVALDVDSCDEARASQPQLLPVSLLDMLVHQRLASHIVRALREDARPCQPEVVQDLSLIHI